MKISIHLMLLLNKMDKIIDKIKKHFNTSYVVIKRVKFSFKILYHFISIHLMLLLNEDGNKTRIVKIRISIHLMLLLNVLLKVQVLKALKDFNTSYVVIKHNGLVTSLVIIFISIHLMLLLNMSKEKIELLENTFQYILCCY